MTTNSSILRFTCPASSSNRKIMRRNGRSFWFASLLLPRDVAAGAAQLYAFCRVMDDMADESASPNAAAHLEQVRCDLRRGRSDDPHVMSLLQLAERYPLQLDVADHLVASFVDDASRPMTILDEAGLIRYCFGVAGTVGLLMAPILGTISITSRPFAADLGIAMQMTNIARDVAEDARNGRCYLPSDWIGGMSASSISGTITVEANRVIAGAVLRVLALADCFYVRAREGFPLIPRRSRLAIEIAAAIYREIGVQLERKCLSSGALRWHQQRMVVSAARKLQLAVAVFSGMSPIARLPKPELSAQSLAVLNSILGQQ